MSLKSVFLGVAAAVASCAAVHMGFAFLGVERAFHAIEPVANFGGWLVSLFGQAAGSELTHGLPGHLCGVSTGLGLS